MAQRSNKVLQGVLIIMFAVPALVWFPAAFCLVIVSGKHLLFGFDDFPILPMFLGFGFGVLLAAVGLVLVCRDVWRGIFRQPLLITIAVVIFGALAVPTARLMTRLEQEKRTRQHSSNQSPEMRLHPASLFEGWWCNSIPHPSPAAALRAMAGKPCPLPSRGDPRRSREPRRVKGGESRARALIWQVW